MVPGLILIILILSFILIKSTDQVVIAIRRLSRESSSKAFVISALLIALSTSFPELSVGITSALEGVPSLSLGNVLGANITNISLVAGLSALVVGRVHIQNKFLKRDVFVALTAGILPLFLVLDGNLSKIDGLILISLYGAYSSSFFKRRFLEIALEHKKESFIHRFLRKFSHIDSLKTKEAARLFIGIAVLLLSASLIVRVATELSYIAKIPVFLIGLVILSVGTTLPELAFSFRSLEDNEPSMYFGNILGSIIANSTLIVGITALIMPIKVDGIREYVFAAGTFVATFLIFWYFVKSKLRLDRWEAGVLLIIYITFVVVEFF